MSCHHWPRIQIRCLTYHNANNVRGLRVRGSTKDAARLTPRFTSRRRGVNCAVCSYERTRFVLNAVALAPLSITSCASMTTPTSPWFGITFKQCVTRATTQSRVVRRTINQTNNMTDITKCTGDGCPLKETCHRFTAPTGMYQSFFFEVPIRNGKCEYHWPNK